MNRTARVAVALAFLLLTPAMVRADELKVDVDGLGGIVKRYLGSVDLKKNVEATLSIEQAKKDDDLDERRIRKLHALAPDEIKRALEPYGFYKPVVDAGLEKRGDTWYATYRIDPGPEMKVASVEVSLTGEGAADPRFTSLVAAFPLKEGDVLVSPEYEAGKKTFEDAAASNGYLDAGFEEHVAEVNLDTYTAAVRLRFETGPLYFFGPTTFEQDFLNENVVRGYATWKEGQPFDLNELLTAQGALGDSPYFGRVEVEPLQEQAGPDRRVPIRVTLLPSKPRKYSFGLGAGTDTGPRGSALLQFRRLNRKGHRAETELRLSSLEQSFGARYMIPGPYPRTDVLTFSVGYARFRPDTSKSNTALLGVELAQSRGRWRETLGLFIHREDFVVGLDRGTSLLLIPGGHWERVVADDRLYTKKGYKVEGEIRLAARNVVSNVTLVRPRVFVKYIRSLRPTTRAIGRLEVGYAYTNDFHKLPPRLRFFAGGDASVRGYAFQTLGERDAAGNVIGGEVLRVLSVEVDQKVSDKFGGIGVAAFFDVGNATSSWSGDLMKGVGAGVRWRSPIGMVRIDGAFGLDRPGRPIRLHLNIGPDL